MALCSVRSQRLLTKQLRNNFHCRWFLDLNLDEEPFDHSIFSENQQRLEEHGVNELFFGLVVEEARLQGWVSDDHSTVDGTLHHARASLKSFQPKEGKKDDRDENPGNTERQRKGGQTVFRRPRADENRHGLCLDFRITPSVDVTEPRQLPGGLEGWKQTNRGNSPASVGADKGYHNKVSAMGVIGSGERKIEKKNL